MISKATTQQLDGDKGTVPLSPCYTVTEEPSPCHLQQLEQSPLLQIVDLSCRFGGGCDYCLNIENELDKNVCPRCGTIHALRGVSIEVYPGEIVGIVGESVSGKSTLMRCICFDQAASAGSVTTTLVGDGLTDLLSCSAQQKRQIRNTCFGMVYQNPWLGLRMNLSALSNIAEQMIASGNREVAAMRERGYSLLDKVNIPLRRAGDAPRDFSGGMQQRVQIAKALSNNPPILLLDEVTTGLDLSVQATVLDLIMSLRRDLDISMIVVSHDLAVIRMLADRCYVMLDGQVIEQGLTDQVLEDPQHRYTQQLVHSLL